MRKIILALSCLLGLISHAWAITEMIPPYAVPYAAYGNVYDRYFTYYDAAGSIQYVYIKQGYDYHDFDLYYYWAGQTIVVKDVGGATFSYNTLLVQCNSSNTDCFEWSTYGSVVGVPASCSTPPVRSTTDLYWGNTAMSQYDDPLFCEIGVLSANQKFVSANIASSPQLSVTIVPTNALSGSVTSSPSGISCGTNPETCQASFSGNVALTATAVEGWSFGYWSDGTNQSTENPVTVTMGGAKTVMAVFQPVLKWPLTGTFASRTVGLVFGANWIHDCPSGTPKKHGGVDVNATYGEAVYAAHDGVVKDIHYQVDWAYAVVVEDSSGSFTTVNWHVNAYGNLAVNDTVTKGQQIATVANLGGNTHFHFGVRSGPYDASLSLVGALPVATCGGYPAYPENLLDPSGMAYQ